MQLARLTRAVVRLAQQFPESLFFDLSGACALFQPCHAHRITPGPGYLLLMTVPCRERSEFARLAQWLGILTEGSEFIGGRWEPSEGMDPKSPRPGPRRY